MEPQKESWNSDRKGKEIQIPGTIMPLLKPVHLSPFLGPVPFKWYLITVSRSGRKTSRFYLNVSRHPKQLPKVLSTVQRTCRWRNGHTFFLLTPPWEFFHLRLRYPMTSIPILSREGADEGNFAQLSARLRKLRPLPHQARKLKRLVAKHAADNARST